MRFPSDDELMAGPNAFGDARIEVEPDAADPEADARAQIDAGLGDDTSDEAGAEPGDDENFDDSVDSEDDEEYEDLEGLQDEEDADLDAFEAMTSSMLGPVSPAAEGVFSLMPRLLGLSGPFPALGALPLLGPPFSLP